MQRGLAPIFILIGLGVLLLLAVVVYGIYGSFKFQNVNLPRDFFPEEQKACTAEAMICPDGSGVGRTGPNCEFAPCPSAKPSSKNPASDLPSLFPGLKWDATSSAIAEYPYIAESGDVSIAKVPVQRNEANLFLTGEKLLQDKTRDQFESYYHSELEARGWKFDSGLAADGVDSSQLGYKRDGRYFVFSMRTLYKNGVPPSGEQMYSGDISYIIGRHFAIEHN